MMKSRLGQLVTVCSILLLLAQSSLSVSLKLTNRFETQNQWIQFIPPDEEFTAMLPARPTIRNYPIYNNPNAPKHDRLLAHREYGGYGDGLVFVIHSFKAEHPAKLSTGPWILINETDVPHRIQIGNVTADMFHTI